MRSCRMDDYRKLMKLVWRSLWYVPILFCFSFWTFFLRASFSLGRTPTYDQPDPKELGFSVHHVITWELFFAVELSFLICITSVLVRIFWKRMPIHKTDVLFFIGGMLLFLMTMNSSAMDWFAD